uniref:Uncharacterized protein n=1 Tax=Erpetoichthys calabaricus TaxID=27687 RepID=A0A8C4XA98_ERPCA
KHDHPSSTMAVQPVVTIQPGTALAVVNQKPNRWNSGLFDCCEDMGICKSVSPLISDLCGLVPCVLSDALSLWSDMVAQWFVLLPLISRDLGRRESYTLIHRFT